MASLMYREVIAHAFRKRRPWTEVRTAEPEDLDGEARRLAPDLMSATGRRPRCKSCPLLGGARGSPRHGEPGRQRQGGQSADDEGRQAEKHLGLSTKRPLFARNSRQAFVTLEYRRMPLPRHSRVLPVIPPKRGNRVDHGHTGGADLQRSHFRGRRWRPKRRCSTRSECAPPEITNSAHGVRVLTVNDLYSFRGSRLRPSCGHSPSPERRDFGGVAGSFVLVQRSEGSRKRTVTMPQGTGPRGC